jgi:AraC family transcriptional regulator
VNPPFSARRCSSFLTGPFTITETVYPAGLVQRRHAHADPSVTLVLGGSLEETVSSKNEHAGALSMVIKPLGTEHTNRYGATGAHTLQVRLPVDETANLGEWRWQYRGAAARAFLCVLQCRRAARADDAEVAIYDLLAAISSPRRAPGGVPRWLQQARDHIDALIPAMIRVRDVAHTAGVHPVYLARQFRSFLGCSVTEYIAARRLQLAAQLVHDSKIPLAAVAYRAGYADQSHLTRAFKAGFGLTPLGYRTIVGD